MASPHALVSSRRTVWIGLAGLAAAMGIGRFAFTPLLPLMQAEGLALSEGAWLASANYLGYLLGALLCAAGGPSPARAARGGLLAVAAATLAMPFAPALPAALLLRFIAGVASAFVLVGISAWSLSRLAAAGAGGRSGTVYAGVGLGMVAAGMAALVVALLALPAAAGWWVLGGLAAAVSLFSWRSLHDDGAASANTTTGPPALPLRASLGLIACYGAFGFGYIVPATFLPAMARALVDDPLVFGWTWPVFGAAAALSTLLAGRLWRAVSPRLLWAASQAVMAVGVVIPAVVPPSVVALAASALCVGGTFMVATMAGLQEARRVAGPAAPRLMAAMTAAFGAGQFVGPLLLGAFGPASSGPLSVVAAALLLISSAALLRGREHRAALSRST